MAPAGEHAALKKARAPMEERRHEKEVYAGAGLARE
jgi:hypothetical protein